MLVIALPPPPPPPSCLTPAPTRKYIQMLYQMYCSHALCKPNAMPTSQNVTPAITNEMAKLLLKDHISNMCS